MRSVQVPIERHSSFWHVIDDALLDMRLHEVPRCAQLATLRDFKVPRCAKLQAHLATSRFRVRRVRLEQPQGSD